MSPIPEPAEPRTRTRSRLVVATLLLVPLAIIASAVGTWQGIRTQRALDERIEVKLAELARLEYIRLRSAELAERQHRFREVHGESALQSLLAPRDVAECLMSATHVQPPPTSLAWHPLAMPRAIAERKAWCLAADTVSEAADDCVLRDLESAIDALVLAAAQP